MYFSSKITNSAINFLAKKGLDFERLLSLSESPTEFMRDPTCWIGARDVENFLALIEKEYCSHFNGVNLIELIGHSCAQLNSWGTLDSVLKMMQKPQDVFVQPERFISYFISPPPPIGGLKKNEEHISFELPISTDEFPFVTEYLRSCIEALPTFMNQDMAHVTWQGTRIKVNWISKQVNFFGSDDDGHNINPEFMQSLVVAIENSEKELEQKSKELIVAQKANEELRIEIENLRSSNFTMVKTQEVSVPLAPRKRERIKNRLSALRSDLSRVSDYFARAQQLITLLVAQDRMNPQVKEAMRRVDWEKVVKNYSNTLEQAHSHFENIVEALNNTKDDENVDTFEESKAPVFLSEIIDEALKKVSRGRDLQINKLYFYNEDLPLYKKEMESVFYNLFLQSIESMDKELPGTLRVVTRPKGRLAEIEISDTGWGIDKEKFFKSEVGESIESVLKRHKGKLNLSSSKGSGSTFVIDLPSH